jgi:PEP-CTERM/exosortase A-associated glycosyltransferase
MAPEAAGMRRALHVLDHSLPLRDGYVSRTLGLVDALRGEGWESELFTGPRQPGARAPEEESGGRRFHRAPGFRAGTWPPLLREWAEMAHATRRLMEVATRLRPDLLHAHSPGLGVLPALRVARALGLPVVYEVRAFWEDAAADQGRGAEAGPRWRAVRAFDTWLFRRVHGVGAICEGLRADIVARGIEASRVRLLPNAVDVARFRPLPPADAAARRAAGLVADGPVVGFVGSLYRYEGIDLLVDAAAMLARAHPSLSFVVVGGGMEEDALRRRVAAAGLGARFAMRGRVDNAEVERHYAAMDVLAYPRRSMRLTELVTPLKPLEAMAMGRVVLASDVGGHRELVEDGATGFLFAPGDAGALATAIDRALGARDAWPAMRARARRFVEVERGWARTASLCARLYREAASRAADGARFMPGPAASPR